MIKTFPLTDADFALVDLAVAEFERETLHDWHGVASALRLSSGKVFSALVLETEVPALTVCAETMVIGKALHDMPHDPVETIVAVRAREGISPKPIPPCGRCREFITDYCPDSKIIIFDDAARQMVKVIASDLLPFKYRRANSPQIQTRKS